MFLQLLYGASFDSDTSFIRRALGFTQRLAGLYASTMLGPRPPVLPTYQFAPTRAAVRQLLCESGNPIAAILTLADVLLGLDASTKDRALQEIARFTAERHKLPVASVLGSLLEREKIGSTALGFGIAIPHARIKGLPRPVAAFVRTKFPLPFGAPDDKPVSDMLVLLVPEKVADEHLQLLAAAARLFSDREFRETLRASVDAAAVHLAFTGDLAQ